MARSRELPADDLAGLLRQWSDAQLAALGALDRPVEAAARTGSLLRPPATEAQVADAEQRLGVQLPVSYRDFLLLSNGAYGDTIGAVVAGGGRAGDSGGGWGFLPVTEVRRFVEVEPETVEIWLQVQEEIEEAGGGPDLTPLFERAGVRDHRPMRDALLIARGFDANCSLLVPVGSPGPGEDWEVWDHYKEGSTRWSSFRAYVRDTVEDHLGVDVDEAEALLLLAGAEGGDLQAVQRLGRVRSPEATELLLDAARRGLGRVGKRILGAAPSGLSHGNSAGDHRRAVGGAGGVVPGAEGPGAAADGYAHDGRGDRVAVPHWCAVA